MLTDTLHRSASHQRRLYPTRAVPPMRADSLQPDLKSRRISWRIGDRRVGFAVSFGPLGLQRNINSKRSDVAPQSSSLETWGCA
jgi:hypothetical protein